MYSNKALVYLPNRHHVWHNAQHPFFRLLDHLVFLRLQLDIYYRKEYYRLHLLGGRTIPLNPHRVIQRNRKRNFRFHLKQSYRSLLHVPWLIVIHDQAMSSQNGVIRKESSLYSVQGVKIGMFSTDFSRLHWYSDSVDWWQTSYSWSSGVVQR